MKETDKIYPADKGEEELLHNVRHILQEARAKVIHHVNSTLVRAYWQVGKYIVEYEQQGTGRAGYGKAVINTLSRRLVAEFGNGFTATNLRYMRQFYQCYPKYHTLCDKLSWSHCRTLLKVSGDAARDFYLHECVKENWSVRQLDRQINTLFYDRLLASRDKKAVKEEISVPNPGVSNPKRSSATRISWSFSVSPRRAFSGNRSGATAHQPLAALDARTRERLRLRRATEAYLLRRQAFLHRPGLLQLPGPLFRFNRP